jgi:hypothetical protein
MFWLSPLTRLPVNGFFLIITDSAGLAGTTGKPNQVNEYFGYRGYL